MTKDEFEDKLDVKALDALDAVMRLIQAFGSLVRAKAIAQNDENAWKKECRSKEGSGV